jgi:hypothetical protein
MPFVPFGSQFAAPLAIPFISVLPSVPAVATPPVLAAAADQQRCDVGAGCYR